MYFVEKFADLLIEYGILNYGSFKDENEFKSIVKEFDSEFEGTIIDNDSFYSFFNDNENIKKLIHFLYHSETSIYTMNDFSYFIQNHVDKVNEKLIEKGITIPKEIIAITVDNYYEKLVKRLINKTHDRLSSDDKALNRLIELENIINIEMFDKISLNELDVKRVSDFFNIVVQEKSDKVISLENLIKELMSNSFKHGNAKYVKLCLIENKIVFSENGGEFNLLNFENNSLNEFTGGLTHLDMLKKFDVDIDYKYVDNENYYIFKFREKDTFIVNDLCQIHFSPKNKYNNESDMMYTYKKNITIPDHCEELKIFIGKEYAIISLMFNIFKSLFVSLRSNKNSNKIKKITFVIESNQDFTAYCKRFVNQYKEILNCELVIEKAS